MRVSLLLLVSWSWLAAATGPPPLLVIAVDAFRHDFAERDQAANILALKREGASVEGLIPSFPSTTFPNFHSMATGLHPSRHGLVAMVFHDRAKGRGFSYMRNASEGEWYGGMPIWLLAEDKGIRAATYFWPGTDAAIQGRHPTYYKKYDGRVSHEERIRQVLEWFRMPAPQRPGLVVVYFSDVDSSGHRYGPDAAETHAAIAKVDASVGELVRSVRVIRPETNVVLLSDHGQSTVQSHIDLTGKADYTGCRAANEAPMTMLYCDDPERVRAQLLKNAPEVNVWRRAEVPGHLQYRENPRIGDLVITPRTPSIVQVVPPGDPDAKPVPALKGMHGYDPEKHSEMLGILVGTGPAFQRGFTIPSARTVDVFVLLCRLLGLKPPPDLDADFNRVRKLLK
jgi:alkaline phosphatase D